ncbi:MAG: DUF6444 domain-containing protein [Cyanobacteriota bacterium]|jgi:hypothetical protein
MLGASEIRDHVKYNIYFKFSYPGSGPLNANFSPAEPLRKAGFPVASQAETVCDVRPSCRDSRSELAGDTSQRERLGGGSRRSSKSPSSDGPGFSPPARHKGGGRKRGGQPGHPGSGPELLPSPRQSCWMKWTQNPCAIR